MVTTTEVKHCILGYNCRTLLDFNTCPLGSKFHLYLIESSKIGRHCSHCVRTCYSHRYYLSHNFDARIGLRRKLFPDFCIYTFANYCSYTLITKRSKLTLTFCIYKLSYTVRWQWSPESGTNTLCHVGLYFFCCTSLLPHTEHKVFTMKCNIQVCNRYFKTTSLRVLLHLNFNTINVSL